MAAHSLLCLLCDQLILPSMAPPDPTTPAVLNFGTEIDPIIRATLEHLEQFHAAQMQHILMAATLETVYLAAANFTTVTPWPAWEIVQKNLSEALNLILASASAVPAAAPENGVAKGSPPEAPRSA